MSRAAYDRARAEYIKNVIREARMERVGFIAKLAHYYICGDWDIDSDDAFTPFFEAHGYDLEQMKAFFQSVKNGMTGKLILRHHEFCSDMFHLLAEYIGHKDKGYLEHFRDIYKGNYDAPKSNPGMVLRAAFRELEHALIFLPRKTTSSSWNYI